MGWFDAKVPDTIGSKKWDKIKKDAGKAEAREGGMFGKKAIDRRKKASRQLRNSWWN